MSKNGWTDTRFGVVTIKPIVHNISLKNCFTQQEGSRRGAFLCTCNKNQTFYTIDGEGMNMVAWWWLIVAAAIGAAFGIGMIAIASVDRGDEE